MSSDDPLKQVIESFRGGLSSGRMAHAYVVVGAPRGNAKEFVVRAVSILQAGHRGAAIGAESHPDVFWIEPQKKSRIIGVDDIRDVRRKLMQTSFTGGWKCCVITAADRLGDEASNAFLKTLEEPVGRCVFFLLTDQPEALLSTVTSRCRRIVLPESTGVLKAEWRRELVAILSESAGSETFCGCIPSKRLAGLLDEVRESVAAEIGEGSEDDDKDSIEARISAGGREVRSAFLRFIALWHRDILMCVCRVDESCLHNREFADRIRRQAESLTCVGALRNVEIVETMKDRLESNLDEGTVFGAGFGGIYAAR